jgi:hypothetical protein
MTEEPQLNCAPADGHPQDGRAKLLHRRVDVQDVTALRLESPSLSREKAASQTVDRKRVDGSCWGSGARELAARRSALPAAG